MTTWYEALEAAKIDLSKTEPKPKPLTEEQRDRLEAAIHMVLGVDLGSPIVDANDEDYQEIADAFAEVYGLVSERRMRALAEKWRRPRQQFPEWNRGISEACNSCADELEFRLNEFKGYE